jgi:hypothetical protein
MTNSTSKMTFAALFKKMAIIYGLNDPSVAAARAKEYQKALADIPLPELSDAIDACVRTSKWFPTPADIRAQWLHQSPELVNTTKRIADDNEMLRIELEKAEQIYSAMRADKKTYDKFRTMAVADLPDIPYDIISKNLLEHVIRARMISLFRDQVLSKKKSVS